MSTIDRIQEEAKKSPDVLEREIDDARARLSETLDALQERLKPRQLLGEAATSMKHRGSRMARNMGNTAMENPLIAIGAGIGMALIAIWRVRASRGHSSRSGSDWGY
jgi:hypothetical protein